MEKKILIIKHGSFGDIILATGAIKSIRKHFLNHKIYLLTSSNYLNFMKQCPNIDRFIIDDRKNFFKFIYNFILLKNILSEKFEYIIDLQNSKRTFFYNIIFRLFCKSIISSSRPLAHFRYIIPPQGYEHVTDGLNNQLKLIGIKIHHRPEVEWLLINKIKDEKYNSPYIIFIPGTSIKGYKKRWSSKKFSDVCQFLTSIDILPVVIGADEDINIVKEIENHEKNILNLYNKSTLEIIYNLSINDLKIIVIGRNEDYEASKYILELCPEAINLLGKSPPSVIYELSKKAKFIISNDTGPAILSSLSGTPLVWIVNDNTVSFSNKPIGGKIIKISSKKINDISLQNIQNHLMKERLI